jgi:hypothetical protein
MIASLKENPADWYRTNKLELPRGSSDHMQLPFN